MIAPCPVCGGYRTEVTLLGTPGGHLGGYDDQNYAKCTAKGCGHRGKVGDWQRIAELRRDLATSRGEWTKLNEKFVALRTELTELMQPPGEPT